MATAVSQPTPWYSPPKIARAVFQAKRYPVLPSAILLLFLVIPFVFASQIAPHDPLKGSLSKRLKPPVWAQGGSIEYPLGTDKMGRDILSRIIYGSRISLMVSFMAIFIGGSIRTKPGAVSGGFRGQVDAL